MTPYPHAEAVTKWDRLNQLISHTDACDKSSDGEDDRHDANLWHLRDAFIYAEDTGWRPEATDFAPLADGNEIAELVQWFFSIANDDRWSWQPYRQELSEMALSMSLCPMHRVDYQACFDDEDPECETIRRFFPNHDT